MIDRNSTWPTIDPGRFRQPVTFLVQTIGSDVSGLSPTWAAGSPPLVAMADIESISGTDLLRAGQDISQVHLTVTIRYNPGIATSMRLQAPSGNIYIIQAIENVRELNMYLVLTCLGIGANN